MEIYKGVFNNHAGSFNVRFVGTTVDSMAVFEVFNVLKIPMMNAKFEVEQLNGTNNFGMWQFKLMDVLFQ